MTRRSSRQSRVRIRRLLVGRYCNKFKKKPILGMGHSLLVVLVRDLELKLLNVHKSFVNLTLLNLDSGEVGVVTD